MIDLDGLDFSKSDGLVTVVAQDAVSGAVLMIAHADREALEHTLKTGEMHYHSRSRGLWRKGATSGNTQQVVSLSVDCDGDAVLARVLPAGPACHTGACSCFGNTALAADALGELDATIESRASDATQSADAVAANPSYTRKLLDDRNLRLKKIGEEATELVTACADNDRGRTIEEAADVVYHLLVALRSVGASLGDVRVELAARAGRNLSEVRVYKS
jgi:phosphoribosyl-AMP cyclohydrolase / phosphoribosyl-ATP pyrophosphohydrolase